MSLDVLTVAAAFISFGIFLLVHVITFRWLHPEQLLRSLVITVAAIAGLPLVMMAALFFLKAGNFPWQAWGCASLLAMMINGLLCFVYVLCVFGPYETSVRMRLLREIAQGKEKGVSHQDLLARYNEQVMVEVRLQRLLGSGDIIEKDGLYRIGRSRNFFFIFDAIAGVLKKWIGR